MKETLRELRPKLLADVSFWGMTTTQFLGAFNDNVYKQLVLLICVDYVAQNNLSNDPYQSIAAALLAIPFVLFSGVAGFLSDKISKRGMIVACKVAEILVMAAGMAVFLSGVMGSHALIVMLLAVLFFMGMQSAFFGPSKYGILPEMFRESDLPRANGIILMTTFLAIIFGMALGGVLKQQFGGQLWIVSLVCIAIAIMGTLTSLMLRRTPIANSELRFSVDCVLIQRDAWRYLSSDRALSLVIFVYTLFWFVGGAVLLTVNATAKTYLGYRDDTTSIMAACMGVGIAIGCITCGKLSGTRVRFDLVRLGGWGVFGALLAASLICLLKPQLDPSTAQVANLTSAELGHAALFGSSLILTGFFAGLFALPLQVFIQARPPDKLKGRIIGAMNLITWIGILCSSAYYFLTTAILGQLGWPICWSFVLVGVILGFVGLLFRISNTPPPAPNLN